MLDNKEAEVGKKFAKKLKSEGKQNSAKCVWKEIAF